ncbi:MAG: sulfite exporter TauE/SafE family protein [Novosphingobium sp.]|nr:sulfite exporter TauE/SafE family protein [Novosphingobium sp.]
MPVSFVEHLDFLHAIAGFLVGILIGLTGVGGGSLMTPLLVLMFGVSPHTAVGTDLLFAAATKVAGSAVHNKRQTVDWTIMRRLAMGSLPASILTLAALSYFGKLDSETSHIVLYALGGLLIVTAVVTLFQGRIVRVAREHEVVSPAHARLPTIVLGVLLGVAVSISSVGAGAIGVTALLILYQRIPMARLVGTDIAHAVPLALVAGVGHWVMGDVDFALLVNLLVGSIPGVVIGSLFSSRAPDRVLRPALASVLLFSGIKLLT